MELRIDAYVTEELARRKAGFEDLWAGKPQAAVPLDIRVVRPARYSGRELTLDMDKQLEAAIDNVNETLRFLHCTDAVPAMRPDVGCSCIASAFGCEYYWGDNDAQTPGVKKPLIDGFDEDTPDLPRPRVTDGWLGEGLRRIAAFAEAGQGVVPIALLDTAGGVNVAADLVGLGPLLEAMATCPQAVHRLLDTIQTFLLEVVDASVAAAGGQQNICTTDFVDLWFPAGLKGHVSDDICAMYSPAYYRSFSAPYHNRLYDRYGYGGLHNCGPNPCAEAYMTKPSAPRCLDLSYTYSRGDIPMLRKALRRKAFVYMYMDAAADPVSCYREVIDLAGGELIVIPAFTITEKDDPEALYACLGKLSRDYAAQIEWGFD